MWTIKQEEVYTGEYPGQYEARDGIGAFIDYYNHRRPHQSLGYVTPCDMLIGRAEVVIHQRRKKHIAAQQRGKEINKRMAEYQHWHFRIHFFLDKVRHIIGILTEQSHLGSIEKINDRDDLT